MPVDYATLLKAKSEECASVALEVESLEKALRSYETAIQQALQSAQKIVDKQQKEIEEAIQERDSICDELKAAETALHDSERRFEKSKEAVCTYAKSINTLRANMEAANMKLSKTEQRYSSLKDQANSKLKQAADYHASSKQKSDDEKNRITVQLKKSDLQAKSLTQRIQQKETENSELSAICEELMNKVDLSSS